MAYRSTHSNYKNVTWKGIPIVGVEDISLDQEAGRVAGAADNDLHESVQFMSQRTTQVQLSLAGVPSFGLPEGNDTTANMGDLVFTIVGRLGTADKTYTVSNVQWFSLRHNGGFGQMRKWSLTGHAVKDDGSNPVSPVS